MNTHEHGTRATGPQDQRATRPKGHKANMLLGQRPKGHMSKGQSLVNLILFVKFGILQGHRATNALSFIVLLIFVSLGELQGHRATTVHSLPLLLLFV